MGEPMWRLEAAIADNDPITARFALNELSAGGGDPLDDLARLAAGSELGCELLLEELDSRRVVHRFVAGMLLDEAAVDDVVQDTLISVAASIGSFSGRSKLTTWVHRIARNRTVDYLRRQRETAPLPPDDLGPAARMSSMIATRLSVREALADLPELYRLPVWLRDVDGCTYSEISAQLGVSIGTVKSQVSRGRALLAGRLRMQASLAE